MVGGQKPCGRGDIKLWISHVITWLEGHLTLQVSFSYHKSPPCQVWLPWVLQKRRYFVFILSRNLMWPRGQWVMWHYGWILIIISHHPAKLMATDVVQEKIFRFYFVMWLSGQRVTWHYRWFYLVISDYPAKFCDHRPFGRGDIKLSICRETSHDHVVRESCDIMGSELCSL